jgi:hypothetical protein
LADTVEKLITNSIHTAFIKYPEGDSNALRVMATQTWITIGFRPSKVRASPRRSFRTWRAMALRSYAAFPGFAWGIRPRPFETRVVQGPFR